MSQAARRIFFMPTTISSNPRISVRAAPPGRCARALPMPRMPRKTVARRSLKAKDAATAATVAASAQTPALRTSGTEEHSLALPASHLGTSDYDEDVDEDMTKTTMGCHEASVPRAPG